jgi:hypothetical protein
MRSLRQRISSGQIEDKRPEPTRYRMVVLTSRHSEEIWLNNLRLALVVQVASLSVPEKG